MSSQWDHDPFDHRPPRPKPERSPDTDRFMTVATVALAAFTMLLCILTFFGLLWKWIF